MLTTVLYADDGDSVVVGRESLDCVYSGIISCSLLETTDTSVLTHVDALGPFQSTHTIHQFGARLWINQHWVSPYAPDTTGRGRRVMDRADRRCRPLLRARRFRSGRSRTNETPF